MSAAQINKILLMNITVCSMDVFIVSVECKISDMI